MKKILFMAMTAIVLGMAGCGDGNTPSEGNSDGPKDSRPAYRSFRRQKSENPE